MSYTTYLFDFDYTLVDSAHGIVTCFSHVLNRHGYTAVTAEAIKQTIGKTLEESFSILTGVTDAAQLSGFKEEYFKEANIHMTANTALFPETQSVLTSLKNSGARLGIISTKHRYQIEEFLDLHFQPGFFDLIIGGEDVVEAKPSPEGLLLAISQLNVSKKEVLYIGDNTIDAEAAQAAEVDFAGILHGTTTEEELATYPHQKIMQSLEELSEQEPKVPASKPKRRRRRKFFRFCQITFIVLIALLAILELIGTKSLFFPTIFVLLLLSSIRKKPISGKVKSKMALLWSPCEAYVRMLHIRQIQGKPVPKVPEESLVCRNCETTYTGNFCSRCGQTRKTFRYSFNHGIRNILGGLTNIDTGFGRILIDLMYRPGYMISDYISGKRVQYFRPFQALFVLTAIYILLVQLIDPDALRKKIKTPTLSRVERLEIARDELQLQLDTIQYEQAKASVQQSIQTLEKRMKAAAKKDKAEKKASEEEKKNDQGLIEEIIYEVVQASDFKFTNPFMQKVWNLLKEWAHGNKAIRIICTLPLFALATRMAFRKRTHNRKYNNTEHIFVQTYIAVQILFISIIYLLFQGKAAVTDLYDIPALGIFLLFWWDYKQLFRGSWIKTFKRTALMFFYSLILIITFAILLTGTLAVGVYLHKMMNGQP